MTDRSFRRGTGLAILFVGAAVGLGVGGCFQAKSFNDSDLKPQQREVPQESNAFWTLSQVTNDLYWPEALEDKLDELVTDRIWDEALASDVLQRNQTALAWFEQSFLWQLQASPEPAGADEDCPYLSAVRIVSKLECVRAASLFKQHKEAEAFDLTLRIIELGHRVEDSGGGERHFSTGSYVKWLGLRRVRQMAATTSLPEAELVKIVRALDRFRVSAPGFSNTLKVEYQAQSRLVDDFAACRTEVFGITNVAIGQVTASNEVKRVFNAQETRRKFAQRTRDLLQRVPEPFCQTRWPGFLSTRTIALAWVQHVLRREHNAYGEILFALHTPSLKRLFEHKSRENVDVAATQLVLALRSYAVRHGRLRATLSELAPEFFAEVPADDFDGKPFRYLRDKLLIYSIGPDLKDSHGTKPPDRDDLAFEVRH